MYYNVCTESVKIIATDWAYPQTLDCAGKACEGQTLQHITKICKLRP